MNRICFEEDDPRFNTHVRLLGVGAREVMPPGLISRSSGLPAYLCILFHDAVLADIMGSRIEILPGTIILWDKNRPHYFGHAKQCWSHSWVLFMGAEWDRDEMPPVFEKPQWFDNSTHLLTYFTSLLREFQDFDKPDIPIVAANIHILLREMSRMHEQKHQPDIDHVRAASRWIVRNLRKNLSVSIIARQVGLSPSRLQQLFRTRLNCSIRQFIEGERLREARYWLLHTGLRLDEIAERTGFSDAFYLSRRFSKAFARSPRDYRNAHHHWPGIVRSPVRIESLVGKHPIAGDH